jgi:hypothetical protein
MRIKPAIASFDPNCPSLRIFIENGQSEIAVRLYGILGNHLEVMTQTLMK